MGKREMMLVTHCKFLKSHLLLPGLDSEVLTVELWSHGAPHLHTHTNTHCIMYCSMSRELVFLPNFS